MANAATSGRIKGGAFDFRLGPLSGRVGDGDTDPIAQYDFALRLQTHKGDNAPLGLYKDTALTTPALLGGDPVLAWRDELSGSGLVFSQSDPTRGFTLQYRAGRPVITPVHSTSCLVCSDPGFPSGSTARTAFARADNIEAVGPRIIFGYGSVSPNALWALFVENTGQIGLARFANDVLSIVPPLGGFVLTAREDGSGTALARVNGGNSATNPTPTSTVSAGTLHIGAGNPSGIFAWSGDITAVLFSPQALPDATCARVEQYLAGL